MSSLPAPIASKAYPIYLVTIEVDGDEGFTWPMMAPCPLTEEQTLSSLRRMAKECLHRIRLPAGTPWAGSMVRGEDDTWCLHWNGHYTLNVFPGRPYAFLSFREYVLRQLDKGNYDLMGAERAGSWQYMEVEHQTFIPHEGK